MSNWKVFIHSRLHSRLIFRQFTNLTIFRSVFQHCLRSTLFLFYCLIYIQMLYITSISPLTNYDIFRQTRSIIDLFFIKQLHFQILLLPVLFLISLNTEAYCRYGYFCRLLVLAASKQYKYSRFLSLRTAQQILVTRQRIVIAIDSIVNAQKIICILQQEII